MDEVDAAPGRCRAADPIFDVVAWIGYAAIAHIRHQSQALQWREVGNISPLGESNDD